MTISCCIEIAIPLFGRSFGRESSVVETPSTLPAPDWLLHDALFSEVLVVKAGLDLADAQGVVDTAKARKAERDRLGLTVDGYNSLVAIAADFLAADKANLAQRGQILEATQAAAAANAPWPSIGQMTALRVQREARHRLVSINSTPRWEIRNLRHSTLLPAA